jgi:uncharacterized protein GlcG (DUF336 family)
MCSSSFYGCHNVGHSEEGCDMAKDVVRRCVVRALLTATAAALFATANAQGPVTQRNISLALARTIAEGTLAECASKGFHTSVVVVDRAGQMMAMLRDDEASPLTIEMARRKAYTAALYRMATLDFQKRTADDPNSAPMRDVSEVLALGGGVPVRIGNETIGGVGSSGSSQSMDDACAKAGIGKAADMLK